MGEPPKRRMSEGNLEPYPTDWLAKNNGWIGVRGAMLPGMI